MLREGAKVKNVPEDLRMSTKTKTKLELLITISDVTSFSHRREQMKADFFSDTETLRGKKVSLSFKLEVWSLKPVVVNKMGKV